MGVVARIFAQAGSQPAKLAVIAGERRLNYRDFAGRIARTRRFFEGQPIGPADIAVIQLADPLHAWIAGLALRSLGIVTVAPRTAQDAIALDLERSVVVADGPFAESGEQEPLPQGVDDRAGHILVTSGTTGLPKKVLTDLGTEDRFLTDLALAMGIGPDSTVNMLDFGLWTAWGHNGPLGVWRLGATVILHQGPERWRSLADPATHLGVTPYMLPEILAAAAAPRNDAMILMTFGGVTSEALWRAARERLTTDVRNVYGATELAGCCVTPVETPDDLVRHRLNPTTGVEIVGEDGALLPHGETGLVRVSPTRSRGYLGDPVGTRAFFQAGGFLTGDLGRIDPDGRLSLQGRAAETINVMGAKLPAQPLEAALQNALGAAAVCLFVTPGPGGEEAHLAVQPIRRFTLAELSAALKAILPPRLGQVRVHQADAFPRNANGKIDRAALRRQLLGEA
jgi:acyl-coenzyme A synthetase/AMP-(fatty) acid ligase